LHQQHTLLTRTMTRIRSTHIQRLDHLARMLVHPADQLRRQHALLAQQSTRLGRLMQMLLERRIARMQLIGTRLPQLSTQIYAQQQQLAVLQTQLSRAPQTGLLQRTRHLDKLASNLDHLNPESVLARGYSLVISNTGQLVRDAMTLKPGETLTLRFHRGIAQTQVKSTSTQ